MTSRFTSRLNPFTGDWQTRSILIERARRAGREVPLRERGKDCNHSTFCDLVIAGLCGIVPQTDGKLVVKPLAPGEWTRWCIDGVRYHGDDVTIIFDRDESAAASVSSAHDGKTLV